MKRTDLKNIAGISSSTLAKLGKDEYVSLESIEILCVLKAIKAASEDESIATHHPILSATLAANSSDILTDIHSHIYYDSPTEHRYKVPYGSIVIRGPDC
ncbi:hypothetical protein LEA_08495 [human gut metagenome]|uniref:XRE family transcriptional regulator n=1 Tax=human gut metagenome TaxID=408170 RepID=K1UC22_9ZZZZ